MIVSENNLKLKELKEIHDLKPMCSHILEEYTKFEKKIQDLCKREDTGYRKYVPYISLWAELLMTDRTLFQKVWTHLSCPAITWEKDGLKLQKCMKQLTNSFALEQLTEGDKTKVNQIHENRKVTKLLLVLSTQVIKEFREKNFQPVVLYLEWIFDQFKTFEIKEYDSDMPNVIRELYLITGLSICREIHEMVKIIESENVDMQGKFSSA
jgi:hypothetical protein